MGREAGAQGEAWACAVWNPQIPAFTALSSPVLKPAPPLPCLASPFPDETKGQRGPGHTVRG